MLIGITGTLGAGKGEKRIRGASQDLEQFLRKAETIVSEGCFYNLNRICKIYRACKQVFFYSSRILLASNQILVCKSKAPVPRKNQSSKSHQIIC